MDSLVMNPPLLLSKAEARAFVLRATGLAAPASHITPVLNHLGFVQLDPLNICGRMHDLILHNRVQGYSEGALSSLLHQNPRPGLEHYLPGSGILTALPWSAWPFLLATLREKNKARRSHQTLTAGERVVADLILAKLREEGPVTSEDFDHLGRGKTAWGTNGRLAKAVLEKLFAQGAVLICGRNQFRRVYDLSEQVLPDALRNSVEPPAEDQARWLVLTKLRQRRLVILKKGEPEKVRDLVRAIEVEGCPTLHCLKEDLPLLDSSTPLPETPLLLAPLDPLIYDRRLTRCLWDFDYTWEVYTPAHKRVRGYYALPVFSRGELVGHVEPRADRKAGRLQLLGRQLRRGHKTTEALQSLAECLGLKA